MSEHAIGIPVPSKDTHVGENYGDRISSNDTSEKLFLDSDTSEKSADEPEASSLTSNKSRHWPKLLKNTEGVQQSCTCDKQVPDQPIPLRHIALKLVLEELSSAMDRQGLGQPTPLRHLALQVVLDKLPDYELEHVFRHRLGAVFLRARNERSSDGNVSKNSVNQTSAEDEVSESQENSASNDSPNPPGQQNLVSVFTRKRGVQNVAFLERTACKGDSQNDLPYHSAGEQDYPKYSLHHSADKQDFQKDVSDYFADEQIAEEFCDGAPYHSTDDNHSQNDLSGLIYANEQDYLNVVLENPSSEDWSITDFMEGHMYGYCSDFQSCEGHFIYEQSPNSFIIYAKNQLDVDGSSQHTVPDEASANPGQDSSWREILPHSNCQDIKNPTAIAGSPRQGKLRNPFGSEQLHYQFSSEEFQFESLVENSRQEMEPIESEQVPDRNAWDDWQTGCQEFSENDSHQQVPDQFPDNDYPGDAPDPDSSGLGLYEIENCWTVVWPDSALLREEDCSTSQTLSCCFLVKFDDENLCEILQLRKALEQDVVTRMRYRKGRRILGLQGHRFIAHTDIHSILSRCRKVVSMDSINSTKFFLQVANTKSVEIIPWNKKNNGWGNMWYCEGFPHVQYVMVTIRYGHMTAKAIMATLQKYCILVWGVQLLIDQNGYPNGKAIVCCNCHWGPFPKIISTCPRYYYRELQLSKMRRNWQPKANCVCPLHGSPRFTDTSPVIVPVRNASVRALGCFWCGGCCQWRCFRLTKMAMRNCHVPVLQHGNPWQPQSDQQS